MVPLVQLASATVTVTTATRIIRCEFTAAIASGYDTPANPSSSLATDNSPDAASIENSPKPLPLIIVYPIVVPSVSVAVTRPMSLPTAAVSLTVNAYDEGPNFGTGNSIAFASVPVDAE